MSHPSADGGQVELILASASPARLSTLRSAGLNPMVRVSGVDEGAVTAPDTPALVAELARLKATAVAASLPDASTELTRVLIGCDSMLDLEGESLGKPESAAAARNRWRRMRGRSGVLYTGHQVLVSAGGRTEERSGVAATRVWFADLSDAEIDAYIGTGEPLQVAGAFTIDGLGGAFVERIEGDHHNVVGISLPLLRTLLAGLGIGWPTLWTRAGHTV